MSIQNLLLKRFLKKRVVGFRAKTAGKPNNVQTARKYMEKMFARFKVPEGVKIQKDEVAGIPVEWIVSQSGNSVDATCVYFHGGGYGMGSLNTHRALVAKLALETGLTYLNVDYRLAPEHPYPAALEDALAVYRYLLDSGHNPEKLVLAGDSAGGGLTLSTLIALREAGLPQPGAAILLSPWTDLSASGDSVQEKAPKDWILEPSRLPEWGRHYAGELALDDPRVSPIFASHQGLAPMLIQVGTNEILLDDSQILAKRIKKQGGEVELQVWKGQLHVWQAMWPFLPEARKAIKAINRFLISRL